MAGSSTDRRQGLTGSIAYKVPCKAATTANITLSGEQTIDGVSCTSGDRVLVKNQTTASENGIYDVSTSSWTRSKDWNGSFDIRKGTSVRVVSGSTNQGVWYVTTSDAITIGTTSVNLSLAADLTSAISVISNVSTLKAYDISSVDDGEVIYLRGYYTDNDSGGGVFYWDATSTDTADDGLIIQATGVTTGRWKRIYDGPVNPLWFGAVMDGVTDDTTPWTNAAATGKNIYFDGSTVINSPVTISAGLKGSGADEGQSAIILTGTGQLVVGDWYATWEGFLIKSAVNSLIFVKNPGMSYWKFRNFRIEKIGTPTGQVGIYFDTTSASIYFNKISQFKFKVADPVQITGDTTQVFNANTIGEYPSDYWQDFSSAITISNQLACDANTFGGYFETGTEIVKINIANVRQNRFNIVQDAVTYTVNATASVTAINIFTMLEHDAFITTGTYPKNQIVIGDTSNTTDVAATDASGQSIPNAAATVITWDTEVRDELSEFANGSGVFTAKNSGLYRVEAQLRSASASWAATERWEAMIYKNGAVIANGDWTATDAAVTDQKTSAVSAVIEMNGTTDYIDIRLIHNQGAAVTVDTVAAANRLYITRVK